MFCHFMFFGKLFSTLFTGEWFHFQMGNINVHLKGWSFWKLFTEVFAKQSWWHFVFSCTSKMMVKLRFQAEFPVTFWTRIIKFFFMNFQNMNLFPILIFEQGNLSKGIFNKTVRRWVYLIGFLLSNKEFVRKRNKANLFMIS